VDSYIQGHTDFFCLGEKENKRGKITLFDTTAHTEQSKSATQTKIHSKSRPRIDQQQNLNSIKSKQEHTIPIPKIRITTECGMQTDEEGEEERTWIEL